MRQSLSRLQVTEFLATEEFNSDEFFANDFGAEASTKATDQESIAEMQFAADLFVSGTERLRRSALRWLGHN